MIRAANLMLALVLVGCRPDAPPVPEPTPVAEPTPVPPEQAKPELVHAFGSDESVELEQLLEAEAPPELVAVERPVTPYVAPPGVGASLSACEQSCGELHDCALLERTYTPATAAAIEISCVRACLGTPERATLFGCGRPTVMEPGTCAQFLACVDSSWPQEGDSGMIIDLPGPDAPTDPCSRVCDAYARCWDPATLPEHIEQCAEQCRQELDAEQERAFGRCADLPQCGDIMACVEATPKAT
jgi:hypothetical protein